MDENILPPPTAPVFEKPKDPLEALTDISGIIRSPDGNLLGESFQDFIECLNRTTFLFSLNKQKAYFLDKRDLALYYDKQRGPQFGCGGINIGDDYTGTNNWEQLGSVGSSFFNMTAVPGELFGLEYFRADRYEVFRLRK